MFRPEDFDALYEIDQVCYPPEIAYSRRELRNYLRFPGGLCLVAEDGAEIAGFCLTSHEETWGYIVTMDVLEKHRKRGVGTALLSESERRLAKQGVHEIGLETATDNTSAIAFWRKHGYRTYAVREGYYPGGRDAFAMMKTIQPDA